MHQAGLLAVAVVVGAAAAGQRRRLPVLGGQRARLVLVRVLQGRNSSAVDFGPYMIDRLRLPGVPGAHELRQERGKSCEERLELGGGAVNKGAVHVVL